MTDWFNYTDFSQALGRQIGISTPESLASHDEDMKALQKGINVLSGAFGPRSPGAVLVRWPETVDRAVILLGFALSDEDIKMVGDTPAADLILLHSTLGQWIRNAFGLWANNKALLVDSGASDADGASQIIIEAYWNSLDM